MTIFYEFNYSKCSTRAVASPKTGSTFNNDHVTINLLGVETNSQQNGQNKRK
jgi:hypothetical protein